VVEYMTVTNFLIIILFKYCLYKLEIKVSYAFVQNYMLFLWIF